MNLLAILAAPLLIAAISTAQAQEGRAVIGPTDFSSAPCTMNSKKCGFSAISPASTWGVPSISCEPQTSMG
jgi:hypothetical protein